MGISGAVFAFASVIGPLIGGVFTDQLSYAIYHLLLSNDL